MLSVSSLIFNLYLNFVLSQEIPVVESIKNILFRIKSVPTTKEKKNLI